MLEKSKEIKKQIQQELKQKGYTTKDVSVSIKDYLAHSRIIFKIKSLKVNINDLKDIIGKYEDFDFDYYTDLATGRYSSEIVYDLEKLKENEETKKEVEDLITKSLIGIENNQDWVFVKYKDIEISISYFEDDVLIRFYKIDNSLNLRTVTYRKNFLYNNLNDILKSLFFDFVIKYKTNNL